MARPSIEELRKRFTEQKKNAENRGSGFKRNDVYPFWQMKEGESALVRILPDKNEDNPDAFFVEKFEHTLNINGEDKKITCRKTHGHKDCPICALSAKYYKQEGDDSPQGKYLYRKKSSMVRVLVLEDPLPPDAETNETYVGKVCNTQFSYQLMEIIKESIASGDLECDPWGFEEGYNFMIKKTAQGKYGTYAIGSGFKGRITAIPEKYLGSCELVDLTTILPKCPDLEEVENMLSAYINGTEYNSDKKEERKESTRDETPAPRSNRTDTDEPTESSATSALSDGDDDDGEADILAQIRNRVASGK